MSTAARFLRLGVGAISLALMAAGVSACMAVLESTAPSPTNFERLEIGTPRSTVESVLGSPESQEYNRATYEFSRGSMFAPPETTGLIFRPATCLPGDVESLGGLIRSADHPPVGAIDDCDQAAEALALPDGCPNEPRLGKEEPSGAAGCGEHATPEAFHNGSICCAAPPTAAIPLHSTPRRCATSSASSTRRSA